MIKREIQYIPSGITSYNLKILLTSKCIDFGFFDVPSISIVPTVITTTTTTTTTTLAPTTTTTTTLSPTTTTTTTFGPTTTTTTTTLAPNTMNGSANLYADNNLNPVHISASFFSFTRTTIPASDPTATNITPPATFPNGTTNMEFIIHASVGAPNILATLGSLKIRDNTTSTDYLATIVNNNSASVTFNFLIPSVNSHSFTLSGNPDFTGG